MIDPQTLRALEQKNGLPAGLLSAVMNQESGGNPNAVSPKGAQGLFQFMPETAKAYGIDPLDPMQSAEGAARMYADLSRQYNGDLPSMLAAYNWGSGNLAKQGMQNAPAETRDYIAKITSAMQEVPKQYAEVAPTTMTDAVVDNTPPPPEGFDLPAPPEGFDSEVPPPPDGFDLVEPPKSDSIVDKIGEAWIRRAQNTPTVERDASGKPTLGSELRMVGQKAGYVADVPGAAISYLAENAPGAVKRGAASIGSALGDSGAGDALLAFRDKTGELAKNYPIAAENIGALGNIASLLPAGKALNVAREGTGEALAKIGGAVERSGVKSAERTRSDFINDLILEKETAGVREDRVGRTKEVGLNRRKVVELTPQEQEIASTVAAIPKVKPSNSLQGNANAIQEANRSEAEALISKLRENDVEIGGDTIAQGLTQIKDNLSKNPYLSGVDASKAAESVVNQAMEIIQKNPRTASGLLQSRKDLDAWVKSQKPNIFDAADSPVSTAVREVRQGINDMVDAAVPDAEVKVSLRKQSNLYRAHENIATKAKDEAKTRAGRVAQNIGKAVTLKGAVGAGAGLAGLGISGVASAAPAAIGAGLALYGVKKLATSPALRKGAGATLRKIGETIR